MATRRWIRPAVTAVFYILLAAILVVYLSNIDYAALARTNVNWALIAAATGVGLAFRYWQTFIWISVLRGLGAKGVRFSGPLIQVYAKSWLGRYIPGTAPWILGKIYFAAQHGVSKTKLAVGSLLEAAIQVVVLLLTSAVMLMLDPRLHVVGDWFQWLSIAVIVGGIAFLTPPVFNAVISLVFRLLRRPALGPENRAGWRTILRTALLYVVGSLLSGLSLLFVVAAVYPEFNWNDTLFVIAAGNLAGAVSMLAVFAPGGIGVREGVQLALLALIMPSVIALAAVVATRLWSILCDLAFFGIASLTKYLSERRAGTHDPDEGDAGSSPA